MVTRIFDILERYKKLFPDKPDALAAKRDDEWLKFSSKEYILHSENFALGLISMGYQAGDKIITVTDNRPEWNFADMGMSSAGLIHVPVYPTISNDEYRHILKHSEAKAILCSDNEIFDRLSKIIKEENLEITIYTFDKTEGNHWTDILKRGQTARNSDTLNKLQKRKDAVKPDDLATIIYTSGTTGRSKGVMLSHKNFISQVKEIDPLIPLKAGDRALSFLPLCHVLERIGNYTFQHKGLSIYYVESIQKIAENIKEVSPHIFVTVPRLMERLYDKILEKGKNLSGLKKVLFFAALEHGLKYTNEKSTLWYKLQLMLYRKLIFKKWQEALGGKLRLVIAGGAALQPRLARIFHAAEIEIYEGYGLTETAPVITVNRPGELKFTTTGPLLHNEQQVKIADDGEILFKGPNLMLGYYKTPKLTKEVIDEDGWFHTGDIGEILDGKFLKITDRKKEMFKLSTGKYIAPQVIENIFKESLFIEQLMVTGENQKYTAALISPNFDFLHAWAHRKKISYKNNRELVDNPVVIERYREETDKYNERLSNAEKIKKFLLVCEEWSPENGELSPTLKLKRRHIREKYIDKCNRLFENNPKV